MNIDKLKFVIPLYVMLQMMMTSIYSQKEPLNIAVVGLTHTHVHWIFNSNIEREEINILGIVEPNKQLARRYTRQYDFPEELVFDNLDELLAYQRPDAVTAFGTIYDHLSIVEKCAPLGIHVMVEKPLAVSLDHAKKMEKLARENNIHLLTNYETTWYPTNHHAYDLVQSDTAIGDIRKIIIRDGHKGPKKIGVDPEFLEWLIDPVLNGGGALMDFGCYGANLSTWILNGQRPLSVTALTQQLQSENNPKVEDEAVIILDYGTSSALIQASWNWPIGRKDMEIYGLVGVIYSDNRYDIRIRKPTGYDTYDETQLKLQERSSPFDDPFVFMADIINGNIQMSPFDPSSLENNMLVMEILDAATRSAQTKKTIHLRQ